MDGDDSDRIKFRVVRRRRQRAVDRKDDSGWCKTVVKIESQHMQKFGIKEGDVVRISGSTKSTAAICLPMSDSDMQETGEPEREVEFLDDPGRKARRYPRIILYGPVSCNVDILMGWQPTVYLDKFSKHKMVSDGIPEAEMITLGTFEVAEKMMPGYMSNLDYSEVTGFVVTRNDLINIPFQKEWVEKMQKRQKSDAPVSRPGPNRPRVPPFPCQFQSAVTDVKPEGVPFWLITENTRFEFKNGGLERLLDRHIPAPRNLVGVIPISKQIYVGNTKITMASLEVYPDTMRMVWYSHQRIKIPESDFTDARTMNRRSRRMDSDNPRLVFSLEDDLGNRYANVSRGGGGGTNGPDPTTMEMVSDFSWHSIFSPSLDTGARNIILTIKEAWWIKQSTTSTKQSSLPTERLHSELADNLPPPKVVIAEGPWRFSIPVSGQNG